MRMKVINGLKIALPLLGLVLLSTLFMSARQINTDDAIPLAKVDVVDLVSKPRMKEFNFNSVTTNGFLINILASELEPNSDESGDATGRDVTGTLVAPNGLQINFWGNSALLKQQSNILTLSGQAHIQTSSKYRISSNSFITNMGVLRIVSETPVIALGPLGKITADAMELHQKIITPEINTTSYVLTFKNNVKVTYVSD
ncbi:MAG: lipopolysaccharide export system protein LptC [Paracoccaceae bacterium]|jgi:lipopolysaccharide export system protein LptC